MTPDEKKILRRLRRAIRRDRKLLDWGGPALVDAAGVGVWMGGWGVGA